MTKRAVQFTAVVLMFLTVLVAAFIVLEVGYRVTKRGTTTVVEHPPEQEFIRADRDSLLGWIFPPSSTGIFPSGAHKTNLATNSWGLRSPAIDAADTTSSRVLVLGDSYAFGWAVEEEEAFPRQLARIAGVLYPKGKLEVINAGVPGYGLYQQRAMLDYVMTFTEVDVVVSTFSLANDPVDDLRIMRYAPDRLAEYSSGPRDPDSFLSRLVGRSRFLTQLDARTQSLQLHFANMSPAALNHARDSLEALISVCRERRTPLLLVLVPRRTEIISGTFKAKLIRAQTLRARAMCERVAEEYGVPLIDVTEALIELESDGEAYLRNDAHWTPEGHRVVAERIIDALPHEWLDPHGRWR